VQAIAGAHIERLGAGAGLVGDLGELGSIDQNFLVFVNNVPQGSNWRQYRARNRTDRRQLRREPHSVSATTFFTVYDQDGDAITQYDFWDNGAGGGHWSINGVAQGSNMEIIVNASQLSQVTYTPGAGPDTLYMRANDGTGWSAWTTGRRRRRTGLDACAHRCERGDQRDLRLQRPVHGERCRRRAGHGGTARRLRRLHLNEDRAAISI
jgi:hypothetical protein